MRVAAAALGISTRLFGTRGKLNRPLLSIILIVTVLQVAALALVSRWEGTWTLDHGLGFSEHLGAWMILLMIDKQFRVAMLSLPVAPDLTKKHRLQHLCIRYGRLIRGARGGALFYALLVTLGIFCWGVNVVGTYDPAGPYHHPIFRDHDVFDSGLHMWSYVAFKICLLLSWCVVYPIIGFKFLVVSYSTWKILRVSDAEALVAPRVEHPDGSYGLKEVGNLNIALLVPYFLVFALIASLFETHKLLYGSLIAPMAIVVALFLLTSFVVIWPASRILDRAKGKLYAELRQDSVRDRSGSKSELRFVIQRFYYGAANASPYSDGTKVVIVAMRISPIVGLALNYLRPSAG
jgi:hypothetical protein